MLGNGGGGGPAAAGVVVVSSSPPPQPAAASTNNIGSQRDALARGAPARFCSSITVLLKLRHDPSTTKRARCAAKRSGALGQSMYPKCCAMTIANPVAARVAQRITAPST
jgi:hypothetical protein